MFITTYFYNLAHLPNLNENVSGLISSLEAF